MMQTTNATPSQTSADPSANSPKNVSPEEIARFGSLAARWWDPDGESRPLHDLNPVRAAYIAARVDLRGAKVADVGCGGGLLSEALTRAGARVTGIDLGEKVIEIAKLHLHESNLGVDYRVQSSADLAAAEPAILAHMNADHGEAIEHMVGRGPGWRMTGIDPEGADFRREGEIARVAFASEVRDAGQARAELVRLARQNSVRRINS